MRSVYFHLIDVSQFQVAKYLYAISDPSGDDNWSFPRDAAPPVLFVGFNEDLQAEAEAEDLQLLTAALGKLPDVVVMADVSDRAPGSIEVMDFAQLLLGKFRGVAWDDYTTHCWTLPQIQSGTKVLGHAFFDFAGWQQELDN
jgi:hypothetical protein